MPTVENYPLGVREKTRQSNPVHRMGGLATYQRDKVRHLVLRQLQSSRWRVLRANGFPGVLASEKASVPTGKPCRLYSVAASYLSLMSCSPTIVIITLTRRRSMATITKTFGWM